MTATRGLVMADQSSVKTFSQRLWKIDLTRFFPLDICNPEVFAELGSFEEFDSFAKHNASTIFREASSENPMHRFGGSPTVKSIYFKEMGDFILFRSNQGKVIGGFVGTPFDWGTYYLRNVLILPQYQGKNIFQVFLKHFLDCLGHAQIQRVQAEVTPANTTNVHILTKLGFQVTGFSISERWGALIQFTKLLDPEAAAFLTERYCWGLGKPAKDSN